MNNRLIKVITGLRRSGKTFLLFVLFKNYLLEKGIKPDHIIELSFEDFEKKKYRNPHYFLNWINAQIKDEDNYYLLLDEIQFLKSYSEVLNTLLHRLNIDVYVTGNNAKNLSRDIVTTFRGRTDQIHLYPLSFKEFNTAFDHQNNSLSEILDIYLRYGGLPSILQYSSDEDKKVYLHEILQEVYIPDLKERHHLKNEVNISSLINVISSTAGNLISINRLTETFNNRGSIAIKNETISKYLQYLEDSFLIDKVNRYDVRGMKYINTESKYYLSDLGLRNVVTNFRQVLDANSFENVVYNELKMRGFSIDVGTIKKYKSAPEDGKSVKNLEIDFIARQFDRQYYIQVCAYLDEEKYQQEAASLLEIKDCFRKIIIVRQGVLQTHYSDDGILIINLEDFLLNDEILRF